MPGKKGRSGRKRVPAAIKKMEGTYREDQHGPYDHPLDNMAGDPPMPRDLPQEAQSVYRHILREYRNIPGVLAPLDTYQLEFLCRWWLRARRLSIAMEAAHDGADGDLNTLAKLERRARDAWEVFNKAASQFGLSPTARAALRHMSPNQEQEEDPFSEFGIG